MEAGIQLNFEGENGHQKMTAEAILNTEEGRHLFQWTKVMLYYLRSSHLARGTSHAYIVEDKVKRKNSSYLRFQQACVDIVTFTLD